MSESPQDAALSEIRSGKLRPVYYLAGEEKLQRDKVVEAILKAAAPDPFNLQEFFGDSADAAEIVSSAQTPPMLSDRRVLVVKRAEALHASAKKALAEYLSDPLPTTTLVLIVEGRPQKGDSLEASSRAVGLALQFWALRPDQAAAWVRQTAAANKLGLSEGAAELLVAEAGTELSVLQQELSKLAQFTKGQKGPVTGQQVLASLGFQQAANIFELGSAVQKKDARKGLALLRRLSDTEEPFRLLYQVSGTIEKQLRARRLLESGRSEEAIFGELRVSKFFNRDFVRLARQRTEPELVRALDRCLETEARLKSNPQAKPELELELLLLEVCGATRLAKA